VARLAYVFLITPMGIFEIATGFWLLLRDWRYQRYVRQTGHAIEPTYPTSDSSSVGLVTALAALQIGRSAYGQVPPVPPARLHHSYLSTCERRNNRELPSSISHVRSPKRCAHEHSTNPDWLPWSLGRLDRNGGEKGWVDTTRFSPSSSMHSPTGDRLRPRTHRLKDALLFVAHHRRHGRRPAPARRGDSKAPTPFTPYSASQWWNAGLRVAVEISHSRRCGRPDCGHTTGGTFDRTYTSAYISLSRMVERTASR